MARDAPGHPVTPDQAATWIPEIGVPSRRILVAGDLHANWTALLAVMQHARRQIFDTVWLLGDVVGYGPDAVACVQFLRAALQRNTRWVAGNHDLGVAGQLIMAGMAPSFEAQASWHRHRTALECHPDLWAWFVAHASRPQAAVATSASGATRQHFVHANPGDLLEDYLWPDLPMLARRHLVPLLSACAKHGGAEWLIVGHTHMPCVFQLQSADRLPRLLPVRYGEPIDLSNGAHLVNPGSVGQPRDGDTRASYAILDTGTKSVTFYRASYDVLAVVRRLQRGGYSEQVQDRLRGARGPITAEHFDTAYRRCRDGEGLEPLALVPCPQPADHASRDRAGH